MNKKKKKRVQANKRKDKIKHLVGVCKSDSYYIMLDMMVTLE